MRGRVLATACAALFSVSAAGFAAQSGSPVKKIEDGILDEIVLYTQKLETTAATPIVMRLFSATDSDLGTGGEGGKDTRKAEAKTIQEQGPQMLAGAFVTKLKALGPLTNVSTAAAGAPGADAIVIEGKFITIDPGSRAKRYFVGFGAGKSVVEVSGAIKRGEQVLATFKQKRLGVMGSGGGDSLKKLTSDTENIGEDLAKFVSAWASGKSLE